MRLRIEDFTDAYAGKYGIAHTVGRQAAPVVPTTSSPHPISVKMLRIGTNASRNLADRSIPAADHDGDIMP
jgi:hypothetical protein